MKKIKWDYILGITILLIFSVIYLWDCINNVKYKPISFDGGYNATVAANVMRYGEYRVSYPSNITFYNIITTGETVILPTAFLYKIWGINGVTSALIPILYSIGCIWAIWWLLVVCLRDCFKKSYLLAALASIALTLSDGLFYTISTDLIGEVAALFFLILSYIFIYYFYNIKRGYYLILAGCMVAFAFLTKSSMIFFVVSFLGVFVVELVVTKSLKLKNFCYYVIGFGIGFVFLDLYKLIQLGGISEYCAWWSNEWSNMLNQSSGIDTQYSLLEKFNYLESIFAGCNKYACAIFLLLPIGVYLLHTIGVLKRLKLDNNGTLVMSISGVCGASLIVYFILLGGSGLVYARRHVVNEVFVRLFAIYLLLLATGYIYRKISEKCFKSKDVVVLLSMVVLLCTAIPYGLLRDNAKARIAKEYENTYSLDLMNEFLAEVDNLPDTATLYCAGWWQDPNVTLYLDRKMVDICNNGSSLGDDSYLIVGNLINDVSMDDFEKTFNSKFIRIDTSEVDYKRFQTGSFDRGKFDNFAIYKICQNTYPQDE